MIISGKFKIQYFEIRFLTLPCPPYGPGSQNILGIVAERI